VPILTVQFGGKAQQPDGTSVDLAPKDALAIKGPCVQVTMGLAQSLASQLLQQGTTLPAPITGLALIDTGASATCIDQGTADTMKLPVVDVVNKRSAVFRSSCQRRRYVA
jgi:hypothetical protein